MPELLDRIRADLEAFGLTLDEGPDPAVVRFEAGGDAGTWTCFIWIREAEQQIVVHGVVDWSVPESERERVALYLTRANYGLLIGNFELDLDDGELRFKTSLDFTGSHLDTELVRRLVAANLRSMERYLPGVIGVIDGAEPETAIAIAEREE